MKIWPTYYKGPRRAVKVLQRNPYNLSSGGSFISRHNSVRGAVMAAQEHADGRDTAVPEERFTYNIRCDGGLVLRIEVMPRADATIFFSGSDPAFAYPVGRAIGADSSAVAATISGDAPATANPPGAMIGVTAGPVFVEGDVINATSASETHVQEAITAASVGNTVQVPAGSGTWNTLSINKAIHLVGAGIGVTNITLGTGNSITKQVSGVTYMRGFTFARSGGTNANHGFGISGSWTARPVVIEDCRFDVSGSGLFFPTVTGGVIWAKCQFHALWDDSCIRPKNIGGLSEWQTADTIGTNDTIGERNFYVEDCYFYGGANQATDFDDGARVVFRGNRCDYSSFNSHGLATSQLGVRHWEVYNNEFRNEAAGGWTGSTENSDISNQNQAIWIRGGTGVIYNNFIDDMAHEGFWGTGKTEAKFDIRAVQDGSGSAYGIDSPPVAWTSGGFGNYPRQHQLAVNWDGRAENSGYFIDPIYIWGNTGPGSSGGGILVIGQDNWAGSSQASYFVSGRDYFNGTGGAKPGYTAFTYPHPLRQTTGQAY